MKIGTWNLEYARGAEKNRRRLELLAAADVDIWVVTETHDDLLLGDAYQVVCSTPQPQKPGGRWVAIWSRLPLLQTLETQDPSRTAAALVETPAGRLIVYGTVLPWHSDGGPDGTARNWSEHLRVIPEQGAEWARLLAAHPGALLCVAGDLNTTVAAAGYGLRRGRELLSLALAGGNLVCLTQGPAAPEGPVAHPFIDHVCVSRGAAAAATVFAAWEGTQQGLRLSDHSAVVVDVPSLSLATPKRARKASERVLNTLGERLHWSYANLAMACAAVEQGATTYQPVHYMIRGRLHRGLRTGTMAVESMLDDERLKMTLPHACAYCGRTSRLSLDHLVPRARGGGDQSDNVVWACGSCNSTKGALDLLAWFATRSTFPPLLLLRRYLKLALAWAERERLLDREVSGLHGAPFALEHVPVVYPSPAGLRLWVEAQRSADPPP